MGDLNELVVAARKGESDAFEEVVRRFQDMAVDYAYATLGDWQEAEDAAQEAFIAAWVGLQRLRNPAAFPGWFRQIVHSHRRLPFADRNTAFLDRARRRFERARKRTRSNAIGAFAICF